MTDTGARTTILLLVAPADADADLLRTLLRTSDPGVFEIARATGIAEALSYLDTATPDCVVVDVEQSGAATLDTVEALAVRLPGVALVALTRRADDDLTM